MSDLRAWLDAEGLAEETVSISGKSFLIREINLADRSRQMAAYAGKLEDEDVPLVIASMSVLDPATEKPVVPVADWKYWRDKGSRFADLINAAMRVNGVFEDAEAELKNSDTTTA